MPLNYSRCLTPRGKQHTAQCDWSVACALPKPVCQAVRPSALLRARCPPTAGAQVQRVMAYRIVARIPSTSKPGTRAPTPCSQRALHDQQPIYATEHAHSTQITMRSRSQAWFLLHRATCIESDSFACAEGAKYKDHFWEVHRTGKECT